MSRRISPPATPILVFVAFQADIACCGSVVQTFTEVVGAIVVDSLDHDWCWILGTRIVDVTSHDVLFVFLKGDYDRSPSVQFRFKSVEGKIEHSAEICDLVILDFCSLAEIFHEFVAIPSVVGLGDIGIAVDNRKDNLILGIKLRFANIVVTISLYEGMLLLIPEKSLMLDVIRTSSTPIAEIDINIGKAVEVDVLFRDSSNGIRRVFWKRRRHLERVFVYELRTNVCA